MLPSILLLYRLKLHEMNRGTLEDIRGFLETIVQIAACNTSDKRKCTEIKDDVNSQRARNSFMFTNSVNEVETGILIVCIRFLKSQTSSRSINTTAA